LPLQAVLLRLLDDWTVRPVGATSRRQVSVLLIAATNVDLEPALASGRFRSDLFYRLNTIEVTLPPLAARQDFAALVQQVLAGVAPGSRITPDAMRRLAERSWPGNIRELKSLLTRLTLTESDRIIDAAALGEPWTDPVAQKAPGEESKLRETIHERIVATHRAAAGNVSETARRLGVSRNTVYRAIGDRSTD
jgi:sigma-54 dependent transcriptional regulator, acetoin dehydrogenase operon transcriptional activator AcoR